MRTSALPEAIRTAAVPSGGLFEALAPSQHTAEESYTNDDAVNLCWCARRREVSSERISAPPTVAAEVRSDREYGIGDFRPHSFECKIMAQSSPRDWANSPDSQL